jgi:hypothetical protein
MKIEQRIFASAGSWKTCTGSLDGLRPQIAFVFGAREMLANESVVAEVRKVYPEARLVFASACSIIGVDTCTDSVGVTAVAFEKTIFQPPQSSAAKKVFRSRATSRGSCCARIWCTCSCWPTGNL